MVNKEKCIFKFKKSQRREKKRETLKDVLEENCFFILYTKQYKNKKKKKEKNRRATLAYIIYI